MLKQSQIRLSQPISRFDLVGGWYRLSLPDETGAVAVTISNLDTGSVFDFSIKSKASVFMKLFPGAYRLKVLDNLRNPEILKQEVLFEKMTFFDRGFFFVGKFIESLWRGEGVERLLQKIFNAVNNRAGFGAQGATNTMRQAQTPYAMGVLSLRDWQERNLIASLMDYSPRLKAIEGKIFFVIKAFGEGEALGASLLKQVFRHWSSDDAVTAPKDLRVFTVLVERSTMLTADALLLFAETAVKNLHVEIIYADIWNEGQATAKFGFDPMIHTNITCLGFPVAIRGDVDFNALPDLSAIHPERVTRISIPVAEYRPTTEACYAPAPVPTARIKGITAVIPTRDRADLLRVCLYGLLDNTQGLQQIIVIDNGSVEPETQTLFEELRTRGVEILRDDGDFNFSRLCNLGARHAKSDMLAFINNDIKVIRDDWLLNMAGWAAQASVGAVGTRLLYEDATLQHGGVAIGLAGCGGHLFRGVGREVYENVPSLALPSSRMAVTGAALVVQKAKFDTVKGFDEALFKVTLNDIDLCLKLRAKGWQTIYEPRGEAYHLEGKSRGLDEDPEKIRRRNAEVMAFRAQWETTFSQEIWFSPALSISHEIPTLL